MQRACDWCSLLTNRRGSRPPALQNGIAFNTQLPWPSRMRSINTAIAATSSSSSGLHFECYATAVTEFPVKRDVITVYEVINISALAVI